MKRLIAILLLLFSFSASAASYCVGPSATGTCSGADWNNLKAWSATPVRGDSWYLVAGSYTTKTLSVAASGTTTITIKKATGTNYTDITATGWSASYANQTAIAWLVISTPYWVLDGVTGSGASVIPADTATNNYGIYVTANSHPIQLSGTAGNITIRHCVFYTEADGSTGIYQSDSSTGDKDNVTISYCYFSGFNEMIRNGTDTWNNTILEYSVILNSQGSSGAHGNAINSMWAPLVNMTIRYNVFKDMVGDGISGMISGNNSSPGPIYVYGNVFDNIPHCSYIIGANSGYSITGSRFYNNTVIHCNNDDAGFAICGRTSGSDNIGGNNLLYDLISVMYNSAWVGDYDAFYSCSLTTGANKYTATGNPFVNYAGMDYRLATNTPAGTNAGSLFATDALGTARTTQTRGAFEFGSGGSSSSSGSRLNVNTLIVRQ